jgi:hypothetical protein
MALIVNFGISNKAISRPIYLEQHILSCYHDSATRNVSRAQRDDEAILATPSVDSAG